LFLWKIDSVPARREKLLLKISDLEKYAYGNKIGGHSERADSILNAAQKKKKRAKA